MTQLDYLLKYVRTGTAEGDRAFLGPERLEADFDFHAVDLGKGAEDRGAQSLVEPLGDELGTGADDEDVATVVLNLRPSPNIDHEPVPSQTVAPPSSDQSS